MKRDNFSKFSISLLVILIACQSKPRAHFDAESFIPTYTLITPDNWTTERFAIPIEFAPSISYSGIEELRFAPGWGDPGSEDYWTYAFLWFLQGKEDLDANTLEKNLEAYYSGLLQRNIVQRKIPKEKVFSAKPKLQIAETYEGDVKTFKGSIYMLDYMTQNPITLHCKIHVKECPGKENTYVFYQVSPKDETHENWNLLNKIWADFKCDSR